MFEIPAALLAWFYSVTHNYTIAIALIAAVVMAITTPLTLKSTKGMLEMQRLAPEMRRLQNEYRDDRVKLNEEMMKLYQEHKVNPMASCLPILAQMPIFIIMFRLLRGLTYEPVGAAAPVAAVVARVFGQGDPDQIGFVPRYLSHDTELYQSLLGRTDMPSFGLDLSLSPYDAINESFGKGIVYALLIVLLGGLYFVQQRMVAARASISPTMSPTQQKLMQYLPVFFAIFQIFFLSALVIYYIFQTLIRIVQQVYITRKFYGHEDSLGRQAQRAGDAAREAAKKQKADAAKNGDAGAGKGAASQRPGSARGGTSGRTTPSKSAAGKNGASSRPAGKNAGKPTEGKGGAAAGSSPAAKKGAAAEARPASKRVTAPKNRPTPSATGPKARPTSARPPSKRKRGS